MNCSRTLVTYAQTAIKLEARELVGKCGITFDDLEDIESEMMLDVLQRLPRHNNKRWSYKTFIPHIVRNKANHILRNRCEQKEYCFRHARSMDAPCKSKKSLTLHQIISSESLRGASKLTEGERREMRCDLAEAISKLSDIQRQCCEAILNKEPLPGIAKDCGVPWSTFYKHVIEPIREAFRKAGLEIYLK
jgi:DNA-directed RNA polymerase specialized sigma24 family protein